MLTEIIIVTVIIFVIVDVEQWGFSWCPAVTAQILQFQRWKYLQLMTGGERTEEREHNCEGKDIRLVT